VRSSSYSRRSRCAPHGRKRVRVAHPAEDARLLGERDHVRLAGLDPGAVGPGRGRRGLATGRLREAPQRVGRALPGKDTQVEPPGVDLDAPRRAAQEETAGLVVVDQQAVAATREQPRDRVVGRVAAADLGPVRRRHAGQRLVGLEEGPVGGVVEDVSTALVDSVGALPEAGQALAAARREADRDRRRTRGPGQVHGGHPAASPLDAHADAVGDDAGKRPRVDRLRRRRGDGRRGEGQRSQQDRSREPHDAAR
jgi:hypothetical protein